MAFTDFYMNQNSGASDLNAGSTCSDVGGGSDAAIYTSTGGNFDGTSVFTPTDGSTPANTVSVGMYVSLYNTGDTASRAIAQVTAVGAGVNGTITVSTTIKYGTVPTSNSGSRALKCGGAWTSLKLASNVFTGGTAPQSTRINIKAATYSNTTTGFNCSLAGTTVFQVWWRGYQNVPGDQDSDNNAIAGVNIPAITFTTGYFAVVQPYNIFSSLDITSASTSSSIGAVFVKERTRMYGVRVTNTAANIHSNAIWLNAGIIVCERCVFTATSSASVVGNSISNSTFTGCVFNGGSTAFAFGGNTGFSLLDCIFNGQAGDAISISTGSGSISNCSFYAPTGNGINITGTLTVPLVIGNCYFSTVNQAGVAAINNTSGTNQSLIVAVANAYYNCTANILGISDGFTIFDNGSLASEAFIAPAASPPNFAVGSVAWNLGFPGTFEKTSTYQGYLAVGAVQPANGGPVGSNFRGGFNN